MSEPTQNLIDPSRARRAAIGSRIICAVLLIAHAVLLILSARANSVTFDEYAHLPAGVAYWKHGWSAFPLFNLTPPLLRLIAAAPVVVAGAESPPFDSAMSHGPHNRHWDYGETFLRANEARYQELFVIGRLALLPVSCLGLWIAWAWAGKLYGPTSAIAAAALWAFEPDLIAHGSLLGTDAGTAVAIFAACWMWWKFCGTGSWRTMLFAALLFAAALLCKFTAMILPLAMLAIAVCRIYEGAISPRRVVLGFAACCATAWLAINCMYGFHGTLQSIGEYNFESGKLIAVQRVAPARLPLFLPSVFVEGFDLQAGELDRGVPGYLLGEEFHGARWNYYIVALGAKLPVGAILLIFIAMASFFFTRPRAPEAAVMLALLALTAGVLGLGHVNIGVRYILALYPMALVLVARLWRDDIVRGKARSPFIAARTGLLGMMIVECLWVCPRFVSFINFSAGGTQHGWRVVNDSNFDWGQGLLDLRDWLGAHGNPPVVMAYFGRVDPGVYGITYSPITAPHGEPLVAVSTYFLDGLKHRLATPTGHTRFVRLDYATELRQKVPFGRAGPTFFIYRSEDVAAAARAARKGIVSPADLSND